MDLTINWTIEWSALPPHYGDVIMSAIASQITGLTIVYSTIYSGADQRKHQSSASLAFVWGIHRWPVNSPHKGPVTWKMFPFDDVIYEWRLQQSRGKPGLGCDKSWQKLTNPAQAHNDTSKGTTRHTTMLIMPGEYHKERAQKVCGQSRGHLVQNCAEKG